MAATFDTLVQEALGLLADQRIALAHRLLSSVEVEPNPEAEAAWEREITRRIAELDASEAEFIPVEELFAHLRHIAPEQP